MANSQSSFQLVDPAEGSSGDTTVNPGGESSQDQHARLTKRHAELLKRIEIKKLQDKV